MANVTQSQLLTRLRTMLRDIPDKVYSAAEKTEALAQAIGDDAFVFKIERNEDTVTVDSQNVYDIADNFQELLQLLIDVRDDGFPIGIDPDGYEVIDGQIWLRRNHKNLPAGHKLVQIGKRKLRPTDSIPDYLSGYILHSAAAYCMELLLSDKTGRFLKTDTTMAEIVGAMNNHRNIAARYQRTLPNHNVVRY